jgi:hypothetical protein
MTTIQGLSAYTTSLAKLQAALKTSDTDGNGALSQSEFEAAAKANTGVLNGQSAQAAFAKLDGNHDGQVSTAEITSGINLATQVQSVLLQGQELQSSAYASLLGSAANSTSLVDTLLGSSTSSGSVFDTLLGKSTGSSNNYAGLTSSILGGGSATSSLTSILTGGNANTSVSAGLFGGISASTSALIQQLLANYSGTDAETASTLTQSA